jgi:hypothetical protein
MKVTCTIRLRPCPHTLSHTHIGGVRHSWRGRNVTVNSVETMVILVDSVNVHHVERRQSETIDSTPHVGPCIHDDLGLYVTTIHQMSHPHLVDDVVWVFVSIRGPAPRIRQRIWHTLTCILQSRHIDPKHRQLTENTDNGPVSSHWPKTQSDGKKVFSEAEKGEKKGQKKNTTSPRGEKW